MSSQDTGNQHQNEISWNLQLFGGVDNKTFLSALSAFMKTIKPIALHLHYLLSLSRSGKIELTTAYYKKSWLTVYLMSNLNATKY